MLKRALAIAMGWAALTGMQAPAGPSLELWRLDCGTFHFNDYNAFFSDTSDYPSGPKDLVGSRVNLPSRAAENLFWYGRYGERCDSVGNDRRY